MKGRSGLRLGVVDVAPVVSCRAHPPRAVVGEWIPITATVFGEGHDLVSATVVWSAPPGSPSRHSGHSRQVIRMLPDGLEPDQWRCHVSSDAEGLWSFVVEGWRDPWATWWLLRFDRIEGGARWRCPSGTCPDC